MTASWSGPTHPWVAEGERRVRFGISGGLTGEWRSDLVWVRHVEDLGFDSFWLPDHPVQFPRDCWTYLGALAVSTHRVRLGVFSCASYRHPVVLARQAADVDRMSGGRLVLGLGIGDLPKEFASLGLPYTAVRDRQQALEEALLVVKGLWSGDPFAFEGERFRVKSDVPYIGPIQRPHVPILIMGGGERVTLRQVARHADVANFGPSNFTGGAWSVDDVRRKLTVLRDHCDEVGRPYGSVLRSRLNFGLVLRAGRAWTEERAQRGPNGFEFVRFGGDPSAAVEHYRRLVEAGIRYFIVSLDNDDRETLRLLAEKVMPEVAAIPPGAAS